MPHATSLPRRPTRIGLLLSLSLLLLGCSSTDKPREQSGQQLSDDETGFSEAAATPLTDLNLVRDEIPSILLAAQAAPYAVPENLSCDTLAGEVRQLDALLGADLDIPATKENPGVIERGTDAAENLAVRTVRGAAEGLVPYRSWIRKLSGAEEHYERAVAAVAAGTIRRAYLKGLGQAAACKPPAAPVPKAEHENGAAN